MSDDDHKEQTRATRLLKLASVEHMFDLFREQMLDHPSHDACGPATAAARDEHLVQLDAHLAGLRSQMVAIVRELA